MSEREQVFNTIHQEIDITENVLKSYYELLKLHCINGKEIPNIAITCNNKIIALENEFKRAGKNFFESECWFVIELRLQSIMSVAFDFLQKCVSIFNVSEDQINEFFNSYKRPSFFDMVFNNAKYEPKTSILTSEQIKNVELLVKKYVECDNMIFSFSLNADIENAIAFYKAIAVTNGVITEEEFNYRIKKIFQELRLLGYEL